LVENGYRFLVTVNVIAVADLTIACAAVVLGVAYFGAVNVLGLRCMVDSIGSRLALRAVLLNVFHHGILFLMCSCWSEVTYFLCYGVISSFLSW
jgi:hypothetical protein